jgi:hypothetical protein
MKLDPELYKASQKSLKRILIDRNFNNNIINNLANIACLTTYGQSNDIDGFAGLVSLAGTVGDVFLSFKQINLNVN